MAFILFLLFFLCLTAEGIHILIVMIKAKGILGFLLFFVPIYPWYFVFKYKEDYLENDWFAYVWVGIGILGTFIELLRVIGG